MPFISYASLKDIVQPHFREFVTFYFPDVAAEIDFSKQAEFLNIAPVPLNVGCRELRFGFRNPL